jgi:hypothetical protein
MRVLKAFGYAVAAFFIAGIASCGVIAFMVVDWKNDDGQAGLAAPIGGFYAACVAAAVTFTVSVIRSSHSGQKKME